MSRIAFMAFLDTIFLVLIMVLAKDPSFQKMSSVDLSPPEMESSESRELSIQMNDPFIVNLKKDGSTVIEGKKVNQDQVREIAKKAKRLGGQVAIVRADREVQLKDYLTLSSVLGDAGYRVIRVPVVRK